MSARTRELAAQMTRSLVQYGSARRRDVVTRDDA